MNDEIKWVVVEVDSPGYSPPFVIALRLEDWESHMKPNKHLDRHRLLTEKPVTRAVAEQMAKLAKENR